MLLGILLGGQGLGQRLQHGLVEGVENSKALGSAMAVTASVASPSKISSHHSMEHSYTVLAMLLHDEIAGILLAIPVTVHLGGHKASLEMSQHSKNSRNCSGYAMTVDLPLAAPSIRILTPP